LIYILTETGIEEGVGSMMDRLLSRPWMTHLFPQHVSSSSWWWWIQNTIVLLVGLLLMRWTGDLFWWARDPIYDMVKWEYHNRQRLGYRDEKWMSKVREKDAVRAMIFLVGIYLACDASAKFFEASWEQQQWIYRNGSIIISMEQLPSVQYSNNNGGMCPSTAIREVSFCSNMCHEEIQHHGSFSCVGFVGCFLLLPMANYSKKPNNPHVPRLFSSSSSSSSSSFQHFFGGREQKPWTEC
jgi:hypothetical protein